MDLTASLDRLNDRQREAVIQPPGISLVLAGAGSGKTSVLVHRIAWLIEHTNVSPWSIMAVTFTNKAAAEMKGRLQNLLMNAAKGIWVGTFHSLSHRILRTHYQEASLEENFQILDSDDQLRVVKRLMKSMKIDESRWPPRQAQWFINNKKDEGIRAEYFEPGYKDQDKVMHQVYLRYEDFCRKEGVVDFAELLLRSHELWLNNESLLQHYQKRFQHVLVDEFQDTNAVQYAWLKMLSDKGCLMAVGDDDQSIYGWRGAVADHIKRFPSEFENVNIIRLEQNYRSTSTILKASNALIANNTQRMGKELWTTGDAGDPIQLYSAFNEYDEAAFIAARVQECSRQGVALRNIAVLYRSNAQSRVLEENFIKMNIPYHIYGGQRFFERAEIKNALAYMRLISNRDDNASFERVINVPTRGIGEKTVQTVRDTAVQMNVSLWDAAKTLTANGARVSKSLLTFIQLIEMISEKTEGMPLEDMAEYLLDKTALIEFHSREKGEKGLARKENLEELVSACRGFSAVEVWGEEQQKLSDLDAFLAHTALESGESKTESVDSLQMMTLHSAKGLEFQIVFLTGMEDGLLPHQMSMGTATGLEEERRLCYVGMTRAMEQLYFTHAENRRLNGQDRYNRVSRFIREVPTRYIREVRLSASVSKPVTARRNPIKSAETVAGSSERSDIEALKEWGFMVGQRVTHDFFGAGTLLNVEGQEEKTRVQVNFENEGVKWLMLKYAKLKSE